MKAMTDYYCKELGIDFQTTTQVDDEVFNVQLHTPMLFLSDKYRTSYSNSLQALVIQGYGKSEERGVSSEGLRTRTIRDPLNLIHMTVYHGGNAPTINGKVTDHPICQLEAVAIQFSNGKVLSGVYDDSEHVLFIQGINLEEV